MVIAVSRGGFPPTRRSSTKSSLSRFAIAIHQHHHPLSSLVRTQRSSFVSSHRCECWMSSKVAAQIFHLPYRGFVIRKSLTATADGTFKPAAEYNTAIQQSPTL